MKPSTVDLSVREPLSTFEGHLLGNPFSALVDLVPHEQKVKSEVEVARLRDLLND